MRSRWSNILKNPKNKVSIEAWEALDLEEERRAKEREEQERAEREKEPPHDCSALQREAFEAGVQAGLEKGREEMRLSAEQEMRRALELVAQVERLRLETLRQAELDILQLAMAIARKVIHREASIDPEVVSMQVRRVIARLEEKGLITVRVHPQEISGLEAVRQSLTGSDGKLVRVRIEADEAIHPGGCVVESPQYFVDATLTKQLDELWRELLPSHAGTPPASAP
ncbi:MAG: hypothetical protein D6704_09590 [Nitrospirae bacterium]|nr:MAG: hypothetical protein D6704_09590 [Nitrospirota bacterium]